MAGRFLENVAEKYEIMEEGACDPKYRLQVTSQSSQDLAINHYFSRYSHGR